MCLFKRWVSAHLLAQQFPDTLAELVCAAAFPRGVGAGAPRGPSAGLLRVLRLLARTDWGTEVLVLDFNDDMTSELHLSYYR